MSIYFCLAVYPFFTAAFVLSPVSERDLGMGIVSGVVGGVLLLLLIAYRRARVTVDDSGITRKGALWGSFKLSWDEIEAWGVHHDDAFGLRTACFQTRGHGGLQVCQVLDREAAWPRFDGFLEDVRSRARSKEVVQPLDARAEIDPK